jgi:hypothetical protein
MESTEHHGKKSALKTILKRFGFDPVFLEERRCDALAFRKGEIVSFEIEDSVRNVFPNFTRNVGFGCDRHIIVCPDFQTLGEVARLLARQLPQDMHGKVGLCTFETLCMLSNHAPKENT